MGAFKGSLLSCPEIECRQYERNPAEGYRRKKYKEYCVDRFGSLKAILPAVLPGKAHGRKIACITAGNSTI